MIEPFCKCTTLMMVFHYFVLSCPYLSWVLLHFFVSYSWTIAYGYRNYLNLFKFFLLYLTKLCDHWQTLMKWNTLLYIVFKEYSPLDLLLHVDVATVSNLLKFGTSQNEQNPSKTSQNQPKQFKKKLWNDLKQPNVTKMGKSGIFY